MCGSRFPLNTERSLSAFSQQLTSYRPSERVRTGSESSAELFKAQWLKMSETSHGGVVVSGFDSLTLACASVCGGSACLAESLCSGAL